MFQKYKTLVDYIGVIEQDLRDRAPSSSGDLRESIIADIIQTESGIDIDIDMNYYGDYLDKGVSGTGAKFNTPYSFKDKKPPPVKYIHEWIKEKGIVPRDRGMSKLTLAYIFANSIKVKGIKPRNFIQPTIDKHSNKLSELIADAVWEDFAYEYNK